MRVRLWPQSIVGRTVLVLLAGLLISHTVALAIYSGNRLDTLINVGGQAAAERVAAVIQLLEDVPAAERPRMLKALDLPGLRVAWTPDPLVEETIDDPLAARVRDVLRSRLKVEEVRVTLRRPRGRRIVDRPPADDDSFAPRLHRMWHGVPFGQVVRVSARLSDGSWLNFVAPLDIAESLWRPRFVLSLLVMAVLVTVLVTWALRRATRPFAAFAAAAERLGVDVTAPPLTEDGPSEVRQAAHAFNVMQQRLGRFIADRTQMLAAISHDLRTPITRMRLRAEFVEDEEQRSKMLADLAEMEAMIAATLAFARHDADAEPRRTLDLAALLAALVDDFAAAGKEAAYDGPQTLTIAGRPTALKRAFANLIGNAVAYGESARVSLAPGDAQAVIEIADDGPGIPEAEHERVFAPFYRLEGSRNRDTGGTGLGLAVARGIARAHGGDVVLRNRDGGGLAVTVTLPLG